MVNPIAVINYNGSSDKIAMISSQHNALQLTSLFKRQSINYHIFGYIDIFKLVLPVKYNRLYIDLGEVTVYAFG